MHESTGDMYYYLGAEAEAQAQGAFDLLHLYDSMQVGGLLHETAPLARGGRA